MKNVLIASCLIAVATFHVMPAYAANGVPALWDSEIKSPNHDKYQACIESKFVDSMGKIERWCKILFNNKVFYAQAVADQAKAKCNATNDNSCVANDPTWFLRGLDTYRLKNGVYVLVN
jgi:hypothetical protein